MAAARSMSASRSRGGSSIWPWLGLAVIIVIIDQFTKTLSLGYYKLGDATYVTSFFNVVRAHNTGAAFSFLADHSGWQRWFFTAIGVAAALGAQRARAGVRHIVELPRHALHEFAGDGRHLAGKVEGPRHGGHGDPGFGCNGLDAHRAVFM